MKTKQAFENWGLSKIKRPLIIAGPCSAESEAQVLDTAKQLKNMKVSLFRAGIWKPRTRPNSFQGVGSIGLQWLQRVKQELNLKVITEIANTKHLEQVLKHNIDAIWIGARTTANPFAMQEIADALKGVDIPVFVKNPINPDCELWIGAIERIINAGIKNIAAIHRGFSTFNKSMYRNAPQWQIPIELRQQMPNIPMICDPSHIGGQTNNLYEISQKALDLNFDGLIIETHNNPKQAWSDAKQQITPTELNSLIEKLIVRNRKINDNKILNDLELLRQKIDNLDDELLCVLEQRMNLAENIGIYKKKNNITILQPDRWRELLKQTIEKGRDKKLSKDFIINIFKAIHQEAINRQIKVLI